MANLKIRYLLTIVLLAITAATVSALQYDSSLDDTEGLTELQKIPLQIGKWRGQDLPLDENVYEILETRAIIHRNYTDEHGNVVLLSIVYYHDTKVGFHAPEACLGGRGYRTTKNLKQVELNVGDKLISFDVAEVIAANPSGNSLSYYFYKSGNFIGQNYIKLRLSIAKNRLLARDSSGALIRLSRNYQNEVEKMQSEDEMLLLLQEIIRIIGT